MSRKIIGREKRYVEVDDYTMMSQTGNGTAVLVYYEHTGRAVSAR